MSAHVHVCCSRVLGSVRLMMGGWSVHCMLWGEGSQNHILVDVLTFHLNMSNAQIHVHVCLVHRLQRTKKTLTT